MRDLDEVWMPHGMALDVGDRVVVRRSPECEYSEMNHPHTKDGRTGWVVLYNPHPLSSSSLGLLGLEDDRGHTHPYVVEFRGKDEELLTSLPGYGDWPKYHRYRYARAELTKVGP